MSTFATPVVLFVFNRPELLRRLLAVLAAVRPAMLLVVADGPRARHPDDAARCAAARALVERIGWPCEIRRLYAEMNLGCDPRIASGIEWAFSQIDEAIFVEDDHLPDPSFFPWCAAMLARYRDDATVLQVVGRNELGRWDGNAGDHHLIHRANPAGWATWRRAWRAASRVDLPGDSAAIDAQVTAGRLDPLVAEHFRMMLGFVGREAYGAWDNDWLLRRALLGGLSVVPPVNLIAHVGFDADATHNRFAADIRALQPTGRAPALATGFRAAPDTRLDRWSLLLDLMATWRDLAMVRRLADAPTLAGGELLRHHLAPFAAPAEALAALHHLRRLIADPSALDPLIDLLDGYAAQRSAVPAMRSA
jgi:hypothetical protein